MYEGYTGQYLPACCYIQFSLKYVTFIHTSNLNLIPHYQVQLRVVLIHLLYIKTFWAVVIILVLYI